VICFSKQHFENQVSQAVIHQPAKSVTNISIRSIAYSFAVFHTGNGSSHQ